MRRSKPVEATGVCLPSQRCGEVVRRSGRGLIVGVVEAEHPVSLRARAGASSSQRSPVRRATWTSRTVDRRSPDFVGSEPIPVFTGVAGLILEEPEPLLEPLGGVGQQFVRAVRSDEQLSSSLAAEARRSSQRSAFRPRHPPGRRRSRPFIRLSGGSWPCMAPNDRCTGSRRGANPMIPAIVHRVRRRGMKNGSRP